MSVPSGKLWRSPDCPLSESAVRGLLATEPAEVFKDEPRRSRVTRVPYADADWTVKVYYMKPLKAAVNHRLRATPGWREWRNANRLAQAGIRCNPPVALLHDGATQTLVFRYIPGRSCHAIAEERDQLEPDARSDLAQRIGTQIGRMLNAGLVNRDHKLSNLIETDGGEPVIIDPLGVRPYVLKLQARRMMRSLIRATLDEQLCDERDAAACRQAIETQHPLKGIC